MNFRAPLFIAALAILVCCKPATESESASDTLLVAEDTLAVASDVQDEGPAPTIAYYWGDAYGPIKSFEPFNTVYQEARKAIGLRDSLYFTRSESEAKDFTQGDSVLFMPQINKAYDIILQYAEQVKSGVKVDKAKRPKRGADLEPDDESHHSLRESSSTTLTNADFMFLGGAPFVTQQPEVFKDAAGNPETHYVVQIPENAEYFFNYVYAQHPVPMELSYGPPLRGYDGTNSEINGIGSITHTLKDRIAVWFLTTDGAIPASIINVTIKLGSEYGCISNNTAYTFACPKNINPESLFGVFSSADNITVTKASSSIFGSWLWEYDIDGDGAADIARIQSSFAGGASDNMAVAIWYVKIGDDWAILDYGAEPDCT